MQAHAFTLPDATGTLRSLADYRGKWVILYFYPKDDTPGCTKEACAFRDAYHEWEKWGAVIIGISKDSVASHAKFAAKYQLTFPILSDESHTVIEKYGAWGQKKFMGREFMGTIRMTYLIDPTGNIVKEYPKVNPLSHAAEILTDLQNRAGK